MAKIDIGGVEKMTNILSVTIVVSLLTLFSEIPLTERLDVYGKFGFVSWDIKFDDISSAFDDSGEDFHFGVGLGWSIDDQWKVFAEYGKIDLDVDTASIGLRYHF